MSNKFLVIYFFSFILATSYAQRMREVYRDNNAVLRFQDSIDVSKTQWLIQLYKSWGGISKVFGPFRSSNNGRLLGTVKATSGEGGMAAGVFPNSVEIYLDISPSSLRDGNLYDKAGSPGQPNQELLFDFQVKAMAQLIEGANNGIVGQPAPANSVWGKGFEQIAVYDILNNNGYTSEADKWMQANRNVPIDSNTANNQVYWLRDWFLPLHDEYGQEVTPKFFKLIAQYWPKAGNRYRGQMNVAEFVHFFSGAAGACLKKRAETALGWESQDEDDYQKARRTYPQIKY